MPVLAGYIISEVIKGQLLCLVAFSLLFNVFTFIEQLNNTGVGTYQTMDAVWYVVMTTPRQFLSVAPFVALFGILWTLGSLVRHSELIGIMSSGRGLGYIAGTVGIGSLPLILMVFLLQQWIAPALHQNAELYKAQRTLHAGLLNQDAFWLRHKNRIVRISDLQRGGGSGDLVIYELGDKGTLSKWTRANSVTFEEDGQWRLEQVMKQQLESDEAESLYLESQTMEPPVSDLESRIYEMPVHTLSLGELWNRHRSAVQRDTEDRQAHLLFWQRALSPLTIAGMIFLSAAFVLTTPQREHLGGVLLICAGTGVFCALTAHLVAGFSLLWQLNPLVSSLIPCGMLAVLGLLRYYLARSKSMFSY